MSSSSSCLLAIVATVAVAVRLIAPEALETQVN